MAVCAELPIVADPAGEEGLARQTQARARETSMYPALSSEMEAEATWADAQGSNDPADHVAEEGKHTTGCILYTFAVKA